MDENENAVAHSALMEVLKTVNLAAPAHGQVSIAGEDPVFPNPYRIGTAGAVALAAVGYGVSGVSALRRSKPQQVAVRVREAAVAMRGIKYFQLNGHPPAEHRDPVAGFYPVRNGGWIYLHCYFPQHRDAALKVLGGNDRETAAKRSASWDGIELETAIHEAGGVAGFIRTREEWQSHAQSRAVRSEPILEIMRIGDAPPLPLPPGDRPLSGVRVLDLTRVLAGPVCTRTLAEQGADVLRITGPHLPDLGPLEFDYAAGKLSASLDLRTADDAAALRRLVRGGDVFCQSYRPGSLERRGFGPAELAAERPGIVYVTIDAFGYTGPWKNRRGYDSVVQMVNGMTRRTSGAGTPTLMPAQPMDYGSGYLLAFGTMVALARRARQGGSWHVRTSLARVGEWITDMGTYSAGELVGVPEEMPDDEIERLTAEHQSVIGRIRYVKPVLRLSVDQPYLTRPPVPAGTHAAQWPELGTS